MRKFVPMTSDLLVRKGAAAPSLVTPWQGEKPRAADPPAPAVKPRRLVLNLTARDYESLGLLAVKRGVSRHALAAEAMALYFERLAESYDCACLGACRKVCAAE